MTVIKKGSSFWSVLLVALLITVLCSPPASAVSTYSISNMNVVNNGPGQETGVIMIDFPSLFQPSYVYFSLPNQPSGFSFEPVGYMLPADISGKANAIGGLSVSGLSGNNILKVEITSVANQGNPARIILGHSAVMGGAFDGGPIVINVPGGATGNISLSIDAPPESEFSSDGVNVVNVGGSNLLKAEKTIDRSGGTLEYAGASVVVPSGVLSEGTVFTIRKIVNPERGNLLTGEMLSRAAGDVFEISTNGGSDFGTQEIKVRLPFKKSEIAAGEKAVVYTLSGGKWTPLDTVVENDLAVASVNHLSIFAVLSTEVDNPPTSKPLTIQLGVGEQQALINDKAYTLDAPAFIESGSDRVMVPLRFISEAFGVAVEWRGYTQEVVLTSGSKVIELTIGSKEVLVDGEKVNIDSAALLVPPGRAMVPLRFISETLGAQVDYDAANHQVSIQK